MSSFLANVISTDFRVHGAQAIVGATQNMARGVGGIFKSLDDVSRKSTVLNNQFRALGTTIRYALAGQAVFGITSMIGQLKEFQVQMGLISAIGEKGSTGSPLVGQDLTKLQGQIRQGALESITPVNEFTKGVLNLLSSVQGVPENDIVPIMTDISKAATLAQISTEDATKAFTTMNTAFGRAPTRKNIQDMAQQFFILTQQAPGGAAAGQQIITQLGQMAQVTRVAGGRPQDMFSLLLTVLRSGIPPAQAGRGVQFFLQTLGLPGQQVKPSRDALASVGITPGINMPLQERMSRVFNRAKQLGISGDLSKVSKADEETLSMFEDDTAGGLQAMGITGKGAEFLGQIFRRIHALRTALAYGQQIGPGDTQKAEEDLKMMNDAMNGIVTDVNDLDSAFQRFQQKAPLQQAAVALNVMQNRVSQIFEPILNFGAREIITPGVKQAMKHPTATRDIILGAAGAAALWGGTRFLRGGGLPFGKGATALAGIHSIGTEPTGSAENPFFVIVLSSLAGGPGGLTGRGRMPKDVPGADPVIVPTRKPMGKFARAGLGALKIAGAVAVVGEAGDLYQNLAHPDQPGVYDKDFWTWKQTKKSSLLHNIRHPMGLFRDDADFAQGKKLARNQDRDDNLRRANELWGRRFHGEITRMATDKVKDPFGKAELTLNLHIRHPDGTSEDRKVHIPWKTFQNGKAPSYQGNPKGRR